uniref:Protein, mitochondrial n=1 Tax=Talaromyces marneffei PM1 TaxID=1077442 RepID=A0A093V971_TALMA
MSNILRRLQGGNLEVVKFGMYILFPIGWMYYFGTNLEERFSVPGFWPTAEQSHKIPETKEDIDAELSRMRTLDAIRVKKRQQQQEEELRQRQEMLSAAHGSGEGTA